MVPLCIGGKNKFKFFLNSFFNISPTSISRFRRACQMRGLFVERPKSVINEIFGKLVGREGPTETISICFACKGSSLKIVDVTPDQRFLKLGAITLMLSRLIILVLSLLLYTTKNKPFLYGFICMSFLNIG